MSKEETRSYLVGLAGGVCITAVFVDIPEWLMFIGVGVIVWDICNLLFEVYDKVKEQNERSRK